jgi:hypothetical protein
MRPAASPIRMSPFTRAWINSRSRAKSPPLSRPPAISHIGCSMPSKALSTASTFVPLESLTNLTPRRSRTTSSACSKPGKDRNTLRIASIEQPQSKP